MDSGKKEKLFGDYQRKHPIYVDFADSLKRMFTDVLNSEGLSYLSVESRAKSPASFKAKLESGVVNPLVTEDLHDLAGVRITTFVYDDILQIEELISKCCKADVLKVDQRLGVDRVGYRSHHWLITLTPDRLKLPEYKKFEGLKAELQIRTILQHAWAQIGHSQVYKPNVVLPDKIKRDFTLLAGLLEIADNEFGRISKEISNYGEQIEQRTNEGDLDVPIDSISLRTYFDNRFGSDTWIEPRFGPRDDMTEEIIEELRIMGITTLRQLESSVPEGLSLEIKKMERGGNYCSLARNIMIIFDSDKYFRQAWRGKWSIGPDERLTIYTNRGIDIKKLMGDM